MKQFVLCMFTAIGFVNLCSAEDQPNTDKLAKIQQQLNAEVLEKPFSVEDEEKIQNYIKQAMEKNLKPEVKKAPSYWRPGYSCRDIYHHGWRSYRNCRYYRHYYGHYW